MLIGIVGFGFVGQALYAGINTSDRNTAVVIYDKYIERYNHDSYLKDICNSDVIFVCVGTPNIKQEQDASAVTETLDYLVENDYNGIRRFYIRIAGWCTGIWKRY